MSKERIRQKLNDAYLRRALRNFAAAYPVARAKAFEGIDFEGLRSRISLRKGEGVARLAELVEQFTASARHAGASVHYCRSAEEAREVILSLVREKGDFLVKSKSMTSEEIELNHYLEGHGVRCLETDLGEWIIQLAGERPSHMVMPAIHKNREEVAELFSAETGTDCPPDIPSLVQTARTTLRDGFLTAKVGLSGANVAVAESGTLAIVTNEGNGRLVTTLPDTHIALVGIEKIVATLADALEVVTVLPRNATGQKITSYVSFIKGPTGEGRELHIVLLDNGRSALAADARFAEALRCVRCGACANVCPIYATVGGHVFGHIYVGGIGLILTPFFHGMENADEILRLCIGCRKCVEVCASKIDIEGLILELRERLAKPAGQKFLMGLFLRNRRLFHTTLRALSLAQKPFQSADGRIRHLPLVLTAEGSGKSLPPIAEKPFRDLAAERPVRQGRGRGTVLFYSGCLADFVYPQMCLDVVESLEELGYGVSFPQAQSCCGIPARYSGEVEVAREQARLNIDVLLAEEADFIVTLCPTCTMSLQHDFPKLLAEDPTYRERAARLAAKVVNYSELAARALEEAPTAETTSPRPVVTYHDACHLRRGCGVFEEPRTVLRELAAVEVREMTDCDRCCGFGGSYSLKYPEISREILREKVENVMASGAGIVAVDCPGCRLQIEGGLEAAGERVEVKHTATLVAERLRQRK